MVQTLDLNYMGLEPMTEKEQFETEGGFWQALGIALGVSLINNWSDFTDGLKAGYNAN